MEKRGCPGWNRVAAGIGVAVLAGMCVAGCGESVGRLYAEGNELASRPETRARGMELLGEFGRRFPRDSRAPEVVPTLAMLEQNERKFTGAEAGFIRLVEEYPGTPEAYRGMFLLGYLYSGEMRDDAKARDVLSRFIAAYPDSELTASAKMLLENSGLPVEEWSTVKEITARESAAPEPVNPSPAAK